MAHALAAAPRRFQAGVLLPGMLAILAGWVLLATIRGHHEATSFALMWLAMTVAMMVPTVVRPMMRAAGGSVTRAWSFAAGFASVWMVVGLPSYAVMNAIAWTPFWIAAAWAAAGAYQLTPLMRRTVTTCRSIRFDDDPLRYGVRQGVRCVGSCWPVMIAVMVTAMAIPGTVLPLLALLGVTALLCWEKAPGTASRSIAAVGLAMLLLSAGGFVLLGGGGAPHHSAGSSTS